MSYIKKNTSMLNARISNKTKWEKKITADGNEIVFCMENAPLINFSPAFQYRSGTVNSKSFVGKVFLRIKRKFELTYAL